MDPNRILDLGADLVGLVCDFEKEYCKIPCPKANDLAKAHKALAYMFSTVKFSEYEKVFSSENSNK